MKLPIGVTIRYAPIEQALREQPESAGAWLGTCETAELARLTDPGRRRQWLAGRWVAKRLMRELLGTTDPGGLQILSRDERGRGVRPRIVTRAEDVWSSLSISHTSQGVLVALSKPSWFSLGVDLVPRDVAVNDGFRRLWFTAFEQQWIEHDPARRSTVVWAVKEAVYKAVNEGQSWNPRQIEVRARGRATFECAHRGRVVDGLSIALETFEGQLAAIVCRRRMAGSWQADAAARPRPMGLPRREVVKPGQQPRFIVRVG